MLVLLVFLSILALLVSLLSLALLYDAGQEDGRKLMKLGINIIVNAGLLLVSLRYLITVVNQKSLVGIACDELVNSHQFEKFAQFGCNVEQIYSINWFAFLTTAAAESLSWIVPFIFTSVGANALSQGLMNSTREPPIVESFIEKRSAKTQRILRYLLSKSV